MTNALVTTSSSSAVGTGRGNEEVKVDSLTIPRVKLLQKMSDEVDEHHPAYVPGAKPGYFLNSLTKEIYKGDLYVVNIKFTESFAVWKKRDLGGGLIGSRKTLAEAQEILDAQDKPQDFQLQHNHSHLLLIGNPETGELSDPIIMDFNSSKMSVSKNWNTMINLKKGDRFSGLWKLSAVSQTSKAGQVYLNLKADFVGWLPPEQYKLAEATYEAFAS
jgi:hypothetical protein